MLILFQNNYKECEATTIHATGDLLWSTLLIATSRERRKVSKSNIIFGFAPDLDLSRVIKFVQQTTDLGSTRLCRWQSRRKRVELLGSDREPLANSYWWKQDKVRAYQPQHRPFEDLVLTRDFPVVWHIYQE